MSLAMPGLFSLNCIMKSSMEENPSDRIRSDVLFWLKYWVVFAYYFVAEAILDTFVAWLPLYNEVRSPLGLTRNYYSSILKYYMG